MDKNRRKSEKSVRQQGYADKNRRKYEKSVRHRAYDGQKLREKRKNCPSSMLGKVEG